MIIGRLSWALVRLPFVSIFPFVFDRQIVSFWKSIGGPSIPIPTAPYLEDQYGYLVGCRGLQSPFGGTPACSWRMDSVQWFDFGAFSLIIYIAISLAAIRVATGVASLSS